MDELEVKKLKEIYPDLTPEEAMQCLKEYSEQGSIVDKYLAEKYAVQNKDTFEKIHDLALSLMETDFIAVKKDTNGQHISLEQFYDSAKKTPLALGLHMATSLNELFGSYNYWLNGQKTYKIHPNLCERFTATNIKSIPIELFEMPFKSIKIIIPNTYFKFTVSNNEIVYPNEVIVTDFIESGTRTIHVHHRRYDDVGHFRIALSQDEIHKCVDTSIAQMDLFDKLKSTASGQGKEFPELKQQETREAFEFIAKCILYITGAKSDVEWIDEKANIAKEMRHMKPCKSRDKLLQKLKTATRYFLVGHNIILSREEKVMYSGIHKGLWKLSYRFIVQGHYRHQPYGEGLKQKKLIFISPYWKGPKYSEIINNPHLVK